MTCRRKLGDFFRKEDSNAGSRVVVMAFIRLSVSAFGFGRKSSQLVGIKQLDLTSHALRKLVTRRHCDSTREVSTGQEVKEVGYML